MIVIHKEEDFEGMRKAGKFAAEVLDMIIQEVKPGVTTNYLNDLCHQMIIDNGAIPAPLNYKGFPKSICTSPNNVVCHGIPDDKPLKDVDVLNIDVTVILDGWHGDTSRMMWVNPAKTPKIAQKLTQLAYETMMKGIEQAKVGNSTRDIAKAMQDYAESFNCSVVRDYCGHGIGRKFHDEPSILNFYKEPKKSSKKNQYREPDFVEIKEGMFFTVEPMVNAGGHKVRTQKDGWTIKTSDLSLSCQFEHTIGITANGPEIFTLSPKGLDKPLY